MRLRRLLGFLILLQPIFAQTYASGRIVAKPSPGSFGGSVTGAYNSLNGTLHHQIQNLGVHVIAVPNGTEAAAVDALIGTGLFDWVEQDQLANVQVVPNDPDYGSQWHLPQISAPTAWNTNKGATVPIAILDSGIQPVADLASKIVAGYNFTTNTPTPTTDTGCATFGHGTAVAGTASAITNNSIGVAGVSWANTLMPLVIAPSSCVALYSDMASAITFAADHGARVINISYAGTTDATVLESAVAYATSKNAIVIAAAGNSGTSALMYPAAIPAVVAVAATLDASNALASFSSFGSWIDLAAPGNNILTTDKNGNYETWYGTSFAAPIVAGVFALVLAAAPQLTNTDAITLVLSNTDSIACSTASPPTCGSGLIDAAKAVQAASAIAVDRTPPVVTISAPSNGASVSGSSVTVSGTATDNVSVSLITFLVDNVQQQTATSSPYSFTWDSTKVTAGLHNLTVTAVDPSGNVGSASVSVNVTSGNTTAPTVSITAPMDGATVSGNVTITVSATPAMGVTIAKVMVYIDGAQKFTGTSSPYTFTWQTSGKKVKKGVHTIGAKATDSTGLVGSATSISVTVQ